jgi:undecaprenyl-diphosphatase
MSRRASIDRSVFMTINRLPHSRLLDQRVSLLSDLGEGVGWAAGAAWLAVRDGARGRRAAGASVGAMLVATVLVQGLIKGALGRRRPFVDRAVRVVGRRPRDASFPSGHTAGSFAAAVALSCFYPRDAPMLLGTATAVGASRIYLGMHFPGDVLAGAGLGAALGLVAHRLLRSRNSDRAPAAAVDREGVPEGGRDRLPFSRRSPAAPGASGRRPPPP